jgi:hypothetical protein
MPLLDKLLFGSFAIVTIAFFIEFACLISLRHQLHKQIDTLQQEKRALQARFTALQDTYFRALRHQPIRGANGRYTKES